MYNSATRFASVTKLHKYLGIVGLAMPFVLQKYFKQILKMY